MNSRLSVAFITSVAILIAVLAHGALFTLVIPLFFFNAAIGITSPVFSTLAMESQGHIAGSASALIGVFQLLLGSITSPLVGIAGEYSAIPLSILIFTASLLSIIVYAVLVPSKKERSM